MNAIKLSGEKRQFEILDNLKKLKSIIENNNTFSITNFCKSHKFTGQYQSIICKQFIKQISRNKYVWTAIEPNIHMAKKLHDEFKAYNNKFRNNVNIQVSSLIIKKDENEFTKGLKVISDLIAETYFKSFKKVPSGYEEIKMFQEIKSQLPLSFYQAMQKEQIK